MEQTASKRAASRQAAPRQDFPLAPLHRGTWALLAALWVALLLVAFLGGPHQQPPANPVPWWVVVLFGTALLPAGLLATLVHREIHIQGDTLVVAAAIIFARKVPIRDLALDQARVLDLDEYTGFKPLLPLGGFTFPWFNAGHYLLRNRSRAFCLLTDRQRVLVLPRRDGRTMLLSPEHPQALIEAMRALSTR